VIWLLQDLDLLSVILRALSLSLEVLAVGAVLSATGALSFVVNIWSSLNAGAVRLANMQRAKPLPAKENAA